ncbi:hypothetical protein MP638_007171 [Amoeboaphelidium occidentale]|nr:hypothetical protein MP638_007171 [Amoeboaphelidium occidentale]
MKAQLLFTLITFVSTIAAQIKLNDQTLDTLLGSDVKTQTGEDPTKNVQDPLDNGGTTIGHYVFKTPDERSKKPYLVKVGETFRLEWKVLENDVKKPALISLRWRQGRWPNVSGWFDVAKDIPNELYYDWDVPKNQAPGYYVFQIRSNKTADLQVVDATSIGINVYTGTPIVNGQIIYPDNSGNSLLDQVVLHSVVIFYVTYVLFQVMNF